MDITEKSQRFLAVLSSAFASMHSCSFVCASELRCSELLVCHPQVPDYGTLTDWALAQSQARAREAAGRGGGGAGDERYEARVEVDLAGERLPCWSLTCQKRQMYLALLLSRGPACTVLRISV